MIFIENPNFVFFEEYECIQRQIEQEISKFVVVTKYLEKNSIRIEMFEKGDVGFENFEDDEYSAYLRFHGEDKTPLIALSKNMLSEGNLDVIIISILHEFGHILLKHDLEVTERLLAESSERERGHIAKDIVDQEIEADKFAIERFISLYPNKHAILHETLKQFWNGFEKSESLRSFSPRTRRTQVEEFLSKYLASTRDR